MGPEGRYLYAVGGSGLGGKESRNNAWRYDLVDGGWEELAPPPSMVFRASWALVGETAYVHAGSIDPDNTDTDQLLAWDLGTDVWRTVSPAGQAPSARFKEAAAWTGEQIIAYGGQFDDTGETQTFEELWAFEPETETWSLLEHSGGPGALTRVALAWDAEREVLWLSGGIDSEGERHAWLWTVVPSTGVWTMISDDEAGCGPRASHTLALMDGVLHVWGGQHGGEYVWTYTPESDTWAEVVTEGPPGRDAQITAVGQQAMTIFGGDPYDEEIPHFTNDVWTFDASAQTWTEIEPWSE
jgi:hypothetical protein